MPIKSKLLPSHICLGATTYTVVPRDKAWMEQSGSCGQCRWPDMEVDICYEQSPSEVLNTLLHECLHLCYREWQVKPRCGEERTVTALGFALSALYVQNPDLTRTVDELVRLSTNRKEQGNILQRPGRNGQGAYRPLDSKPRHLLPCKNVQG